MRVRIAIAVSLLALTPVMPARAASIGIETHLVATLTGDLIVTGSYVVVEASDDERMAAYAPQLALDTDPPTPDVGVVCVIAQAERMKRRMRTTVVESACPRRATGFVFNPATSTLAINSTVATKIWTRVWRVIGNRWKLVVDKTLPSSATVDLRWVRAQQPSYEPAFCGFGPGLQRRSVTDVEGTVRFNGSRLTATIPSAARGELVHTACTNLNVF